MAAAAHSHTPALSFGWCGTAWEDPLITGTQVVKLSPHKPLHFRNAYFCTPIFTADGRTMLMGGIDPRGVPPEWGGAGSCPPNRHSANLFAVDLLAGECRDYGATVPGVNGLWCRRGIEMFRQTEYVINACSRLDNLNEGSA